MAQQTNIQWCDASWSPWLGCSKVSPGCKNCYITGTPALRFRGLKHGQPRQRTSESYWNQPLKWNREAMANGKWQMANGMRRMRVFPSLCDWLDDEVPIEWLADFLRLIRATPNLDWLLLTKRPELFRERRARAMQWIGQQAYDRDFENWLLDWEGRSAPRNAPANVWLGVSVEDQPRADERIPKLLEIPARVRFLSVEPLLGEVDLKMAVETFHTYDPMLNRNPPPIDWVIVGGESGPGARPCNVEWIRDVVRQCKRAGLPCFVKQLGSKPCISGISGLQSPDGDQYWHPFPILHKKGGDPSEWPEDLQVREWPKEVRSSEFGV